MFPECKRAAEVRGVCKTCYQLCARAVRNDLTTWEELENLKIVLPRHKAKKERNRKLQRLMDFLEAHRPQTKKDK